MGERIDRDSPLNEWLSGLSHDLADGEIAGYFALGGNGREPARSFAIVQLPASVGPMAVGRHVAKRQRLSVSARIAAALEEHAAHARDLEEQLAEARAYAEEVAHERDQAVERREQAAGDSRAARERIAALQDELKEWRRRASVAEGEVLRLQLERSDTGAGEGPGDEPRGEPGGEQMAALLAELEETRAKLERATRNWREAEAKSDAAWRRVGEVQNELDEHREKSIARSAQQRRDAQLAMTKAMEDASMKLVGVRDQLLRCEQRCEEMQARIDALEATNAELEAEVARHRTRVADSEEP